MKQLGELDPQQLKEDDEFRALFEPLPEDVYRGLVESIRRVGILIPLIVACINGAYVILSGHHRRKAALELSIDKVPCNLAETYEEIEDALFDNVFRRQMTEAQRKEAIGKKGNLIDSVMQKTVIPEVYDLFTRNKIDRKLLNNLATLPIDTQKEYLNALAGIKASPDEAALKAQEKGLRDEFDRTLVEKDKSFADAMAEIQKDKEEGILAATAEIKKEKDELAERLAAMNKDLSTKEEELAELRKTAKAVLELKDQYTAEREELKKEIEKELKTTDEEEQQIRAEQGKALKEKDKKIGELEEKIKSLETAMTGKETEIKGYHFSVSQILEQYKIIMARYDDAQLLLNRLKMGHDALGLAFDVVESFNQVDPTIAAKVTQIIKRIKTIGNNIDAACHSKITKLSFREEDVLKEIKKNVEKAMKGTQQKETTAHHEEATTQPPPLALIRE